MKENNQKRRILVVEPESEFLSMLMDFLAAQRFEVETAPTGDEGIKKALKFNPDIVLVSRELPMADGTAGPDGLRVLKGMRSDRKLCRIPVILSSMDATDKDFDRYRNLKFSADDYVKKPFEDTEILRRIENLVGFDLSEGMDQIKDKIHDVIDDDQFDSIFDADPEELGASSAATRKEVTQLLEQMGLELDRPEDSAEHEEHEQETKAPPLETLEVEDEQIRHLRHEVQTLNRTLDRVQKQLKSERKRSRKIKREWKKRLQDIAKKLQKSEEREALMREEFNNMREQVADLELDHTMEMEKVQAEKRRIEEELLILKELEPDPSKSQYPRDKMAEDLSLVAKALQAVISRMEDEDEGD